MFKQTWWDSNLNNRMDEFLNWIGNSSAESKVYFRKLIREHFSNCKSMLDVGCGPATEFFAFKSDSIDIEYTGVDSSSILFEKNKSLGVPMIFAESHKIPVSNRQFDIVFSRHVLEHQPDFKPQLEEMIRCARKVVFHIFFIKPGSFQKISFDEKSNLYHNQFSQIEIENFLNTHENIDRFEWEDINSNENILKIYLKK